MKIDHNKFIAACGKFNNSQKSGMGFLLICLENDPNITDIRWAAYMMATTGRECGGEFRPIAEYGNGKGRPYGQPDGPSHLIYYGRGYVQLTWYVNYKTMTNAWNKQHPNAKIDFTAHPELLLIPEYAYWVMSYGMRNGSFTGVSLSKYISGDKCDYLNARKIINSLDHAAEIAKAAEWFERTLRDCLI